VSRFFRAPDRPALLVGARGLNGSYRVLVALEVDGQFLQFRTLDYLHCQADHKYATEVLKVIGDINFTRRILKLGWDPSDGEIVGYADACLMDSKLTQGQFKRMVEIYLPALDLSYGRIKTTMETGKDPGDLDPQEVARRLAGSGSLPKAVEDLLSRLRGKGERVPEQPPPKVPTL